MATLVQNAIKSLNAASPWLHVHHYSGKGISDDFQLFAYGMSGAGRLSASSPCINGLEAG